MTKLTIASATEIDAALAKQLSDWFEDEFGSADRWAAPGYLVLLHLDGQLAGRLGILDTKVCVAGETFRMGGIGGVATKPEFRYRGVASEMLSRAADFMKNDLRLNFGLLLCRHEVSPVYAKSGWISVSGPTTFTRGGVLSTYPNDTMILQLAHEDWPPGPIDMMGLPW